MYNLIAKLLGTVGKITAESSTGACMLFYVFDEPEMPAHLIER